jgi:hypothetical protein
MFTGAVQHIVGSAIRSPIAETNGQGLPEMFEDDEQLGSSQAWILRPSSVLSSGLTATWELALG